MFKRRPKETRVLYPKWVRGMFNRFVYDKLMELGRMVEGVMATLQEYRDILANMATGLDTASTSIGKIAADIQRIKDGLSNPGLSEAEEATLLAELGAVATKAQAVADALVALDAENPEP